MPNFLPIDTGADADIEAVELLDGSTKVYRQAGFLGDPTTLARKARVKNADPAGTDDGLVVRLAYVGAGNYHAVATASTNAANIKASAGRVVGWSIYNNSNKTDPTSVGYPIYVKFHNTSGTPTAGSGVAHTIAIQAGTSAVPCDVQSGIAFATGIGISIVKGIADNDATPVAMQDCVVDIKYY